MLDPGGTGWRAVGPLGTPRLQHVLVALRDGRALVLGGSPDDETLLESTEVFDPDTERFSVGPGLHEPRYKLPGGAVVLGDHVVVAGDGRIRLRREAFVLPAPGR